MQTWPRILSFGTLLTVLLVALVSCSEHTGSTVVDFNPVADATAPATAADATVAPVADASSPVVLCCEGTCDAPAGTCCSDGTCHGKHALLPLAP